MRSPFLNGEEKLPGGMMNKNSPEYKSTLKKSNQKSSNTNIIEKGYRDPRFKDKFNKYNAEYPLFEQSKNTSLKSTPNSSVNTQASTANAMNRIMKGNAKPVKSSTANAMNTIMKGSVKPTESTTGKQIASIGKPRDFSNLPIISRNDKSSGISGAEAMNFLPYVGEAVDAGSAIGDLAKGDYLGAGLSTAGLMLPFVSGNLVKKGAKKIYDKVWSTTGRAEAKLLKDPNFVRVYTTDGSSKIMDKKFTKKLYRTEDANISNKLYDKPSVEYNTYNWAGDNTFSQAFYNKKTKNALNPDIKLKSDEKRRFFEMYFDKNDAKMFSLDSKTAPKLASSMSKAPGEYVVPPSIMKDIRKRGSGYGFQVSEGTQGEISERLFGKSMLEETFSTSSKNKRKRLQRLIWK